MVGPRTVAVEVDDHGDWLVGVDRVPSPNRDARPPGVSIDLLVIHGISLPPGTFGTPYVADLFCNRLDPARDPYFETIQDLRVSAHVLIDRDGALTQFVPFTSRAWHAGESRFGGRSACNDFSIGIELEGTDEIPYEDVQYQRLAALAWALMRRWPGITPARVVGHCHVAPGRKSDPGASFEWPRLRALLEVSLPPP